MEVPDDKKGERSGRGAGSWSRAKVFVMVGSEEDENPKSPRKLGKAGHVRMIVVSDLESGTIPLGTGESVSAEASVVGDDTKSHVKFPEMSKEYAGRIVSVNEAGKVAFMMPHGNSGREDWACRHLPRYQAGIPERIPQ